MKGRIKKKFHFNVLIIFAVCTALSFAMAVHVINSRVESKKGTARYTAESAARRIQSEIETYIVAGDTIKKHLVAYGEEATLEKYEHLTNILMDDEGVIECLELAKDGIISDIYPLEGNESAMNLNLLKDAKRYKYAKYAKDKGMCTLAGPLELVQAKKGGLIIIPIYIPDKKGVEKFWGFSVVVIDWDKFMNKVNLGNLVETGYSYTMWRENSYTNKNEVLAKSADKVDGDAMQVNYKVLNDVWHIRIKPKKGWYAMNTMIQQVIMVIIIPILGTIGIWMYLVNKQHENTYKVQLERARIKAEQASDAKTRFLCNMSHDIRTPMNAVLGFTKIARENIDNVNIVKESLKKVDIAGHHLLKLINDVLNVARIESGKMSSKVDLQNLLEFGNELIVIFEQEMKKKNLEFSVNYYIENENVLCDAHHIREVCVNLLSNAMKFTPSGGKIACNIRQLEFNQDEDAMYEIEIVDTGIGMSKEFQKIQYQLFERERTTAVAQTEGTGLGLPIVKRLVEMLNGKITCTSELGKGTSYKIRLPFKIEQVVNKEKDVFEGREEQFEGKRVLLVEDVELNREIAEYILEDMGFEVESATDGKEAVDKITYAAPDYYDIVLMDIQMPVMDGYEATRQIRALEDVKKAGISIFAMTANAFEEDKQKALKAGMNGHLAKPIEVDKLYKVLREW